MNKIAEVLSSDSELLETSSVIRFSRLLAMKSSIVGWCNFHKHIVWGGQMSKNLLKIDEIPQDPHHFNLKRAPTNRTETLCISQ